MRLLFSLNMPSGGNDLVHQVVGELYDDSFENVLDVVEHSNFILIRHVTYERQPDGTRTWVTRGDMILNTYHIAKIAVSNIGART